MTLIRLLLIGAVVVFGLFLVLHVTGGATTGGRWTNPADESLAALEAFATPMPFRSSADCKECHEEIYREWEGSHHRIAYTNPEVQFLSKGFQDRDCLPCHLPRPVFESGLGVRVLERALRHDEGVDCMTCHFHPEKQAMIGPGPIANPGAPCQPRAHPSISELSLCTPCHNQHKVHDDWLQTEYGAKGADTYKDCNACHMPVVTRADGSKGRDHRFPGAHDLAFLKTAASVSAEAAEDRTLLVTVKNDGTGHHFPADERHRAADVHLLVEDESGRRIDVRLDRYRNPYRQGEWHLDNPFPTPGSTHDYELDIPGLGKASVHAVRVAAAFNPNRVHAFPKNTQIPAGEARSYRVRLPESVRRVTVRLWYRKQPLLEDAKSALLHELDVSW